MREMICSDVALNELCAWTACDTRQRNTGLSSKLRGAPVRRQTDRLAARSGSLQRLSQVAAASTSPPRTVQRWNSVWMRIRERGGPTG